MTRLPLLAREEAPLLARRWYAADGETGALVRSLAPAPDVLAALMPFLAEVMGESSLDLATKELVVVRVSHLNGCRYCLATHAPAAVTAGLAPEIVAALRADDAAERLPPRERALVAWVDRVTLDPHGVGDELLAATREHVRDDELLELTLLAGAIGMLNRYAIALELPLPG